MKSEVYLSFLLLLSVALGQPTGSAQFVFIPTDSDGVGFFDNTPVSELNPAIIGDNPGQTLGELRQICLQSAAQKWSQYLKSDVPIRVEITYQDFEESRSLAGASATAYTANFTNAPLPDVYYPLALANSISGRDLATSLEDISVIVNSNAALETGNNTWYYGLDHNTPSSMYNFVIVIAHELGHGLGFASYTDLSTGNHLYGDIDIYSKMIRDTTLDRTWDEMTSSEIQVSAINSPNTVWDGGYANAAARGVNNYLYSGVHAYSSTATRYDARRASFGATPPVKGISGKLVLVDDGVGAPNNAGTVNDAAQAILNGEELDGSIALIERGEEFFDVKVSRAQVEGAIAVVIFNNVLNEELISPTSSNNANPFPVIPVIFVSGNTGTALKTLLASSQEQEVTVFSSDLYIGSDEIDFSQKIQLYTPSNLTIGSSISHWSTTTLPNLLMEPNINFDITEDLDLSPLLMKDIGWTTQDIAIPHKTYDLWLAENNLSLEIANTLPNDDFDRDGLPNIIEYVQDQNPTENTQDLGRGLSINENSISYIRSTILNDVSLSYESSQGLNELGVFDWSPINGLESLERVDSQHENVTIPVDLNNTNTAQFYQYRVTVE